MDVFRHSAAALAAAIGAPVAAAALALRPRWRAGWRERLGAGPVAEGGIWLHAASVGEVMASAKLVASLRARGHALTLSTTSATGRALCAQLHPGTAHRLAPLDHPWCVDAVLDRGRPRAVVLVETELWPVWIAACERRAVPVVVVSGRISDRSLPRYRWLTPWLAGSLARLRAIGARTQRDAERFVALGAPPDRVAVTGDLKLDPDALPALARDVAAWLGDAALVVAGSTHAGEEQALLDALAAWEHAGRRAALVLAPRHPQRAPEVVELARRAGRRVALRSEPGAAPLGAGDVGVLDTLGELTAVYTRAAVAFVGGTLVPVGGHNVLEPAAAGAPVVYGPHVANVRHAVELLESVSAGERVANVASLGDAIARALADECAARERGAAGRTALAAHRGSSERSADLVESALRAVPGGA